MVGGAVVGAGAAAVFMMMFLYRITHGAHVDELTTTPTHTGSCNHQRLRRRH